MTRSLFHSCNLPASALIALSIIFCLHQNAEALSRRKPPVRPASGNTLLNATRAGRMPMRQSNAGLQTATAGYYWSKITTSIVDPLFSVSIADKNHIWVGANNGAVHRTDDGGGEWFHHGLSVGLPVEILEAVSGDTAFVGTNRPNDARIWRTINSGGTFELVYQNTGTNAYIDAVHMFDRLNGVALGDPVDSVWVLLRTSDGGSSWHPAASVPQTDGEFGWSNCFAWNGTQNGWFGTNRGRIYRTTDGGTTWTPHALPLSSCLDLTFPTPSLGVAVGDFGAATCRTSDGGLTWSSIENVDDHIDYASIIEGTSNPLRYWIPCLSNWGTSDIFASGDGDAWMEEAGIFQNLSYLQVKAVGSPDSLVGYAVGEGGIILRLQHKRVPTIDSFTPVAGPVGSIVTITGTNFSPVPADNCVRFGSIKAPVTEASTTSLVVAVPPNAGGGSITVGVRGLHASSTQRFTLTYEAHQPVDSSAFETGWLGIMRKDLAFGDLDEDGLPDMVVTADFTQFNMVHNRTTVAGSLSSASFNLFQLGTTINGAATKPVICDLDGDGRLDITIGFSSPSSSGFVMCRNASSNAGSIHISNFATLTNPTGILSYGVAASDIDNDGRCDILLANAWNGSPVSLEVYRNASGAGSLLIASPHNILDTSVVLDSIDCITAADMDGDGRSDVLYIDDASGTLYVQQNTTLEAGFPAFGAAQIFHLPSAVLNSYGVSAADVDGDGRLDLVVTNRADHSFSMLRNTSAGGSISFDDPVTVALGSTEEPCAQALADIDGDGKLDLAIVIGNQAKVKIMKNTVAPGAITGDAFTPLFDLATDANPHGIDMADLDSDGKPDMVITCTGGNIIVYHNTIPVPMRIAVRGTWSLLSLPLSAVNDSVAAIFPNAAGSARVYTPGVGYEEESRLAPGKGFWLRFPADQMVDLVGFAHFSDSVTVTTGWNLIGAINTPLDASSIATVPPGLVTSRFFTFQGKYVVDDTIRPGVGYWVKASGPGVLLLGGLPGGTAAENLICIRPTGERPPEVPEGVQPSSDDVLPAVYALSQNYPNPFNPSTEIPYTLPVDADVRLALYNTLGELVTVLVNGRQSAGYKHVTLEAQGLPSGVYFYRLTAGEFTDTRKLVVVK